MKKLISLILMVLSISCAIFAVGCFEKSYTVTLNADGGVVEFNELSLKIGDSYVLPTPEKEGYIFKSWMINSSKMNIKGSWDIESDVTLVASYEPKKYNVTWVDKLENEVASYTVSYDSPYEFEIPSKIELLYEGLIDYDTGKEFAISGDKWNIDRDVKLIVDYKPIVVTLNVNGGDGNFPYEILVEYGEMFDDTLYTPKKVGYAFVGWMYGTVNCSDKVWNITKDAVELKAKWTDHTGQH